MEYHNYLLPILLIAFMRRQVLWGGSWCFESSWKGEHLNRVSWLIFCFQTNFLHWTLKFAYQFASMFTLRRVWKKSSLAPPRQLFSRLWLDYICTRSSEEKCSKSITIESLIIVTFWSPLVLRTLRPCRTTCFNFIVSGDSKPPCKLHVFLSLKIICDPPRYLPPLFVVHVFALNLVQHYKFTMVGEFIEQRLFQRLMLSTFEVGWLDLNQTSSGIVCSKLAKEVNVETIIFIYPHKIYTVFVGICGLKKYKQFRCLTRILNKLFTMKLLFNI